MPILILNLSLINSTKNILVVDDSDLERELLIEVLKGADLEIRAGEIVALVGPSGSGKSTLLHVAGLLESPTSGELQIDGQDCTHLKDHERTMIRRCG